VPRMVRLNRVQAREHNRARVLAAARDEFAARGFRDAKIDEIAERAELTRGAVYSNFPGKRALYLAVLADIAEHGPGPQTPHQGTTVAAALGAFGRAWVGRLADEPALGTDLLAEIIVDERVRRPFTQLLRLAALVLALAAEQLRPPPSMPGEPPARLVRLAENVLTLLYGARQLAAAAPGFGEPFDIVSACERLAGLGLNDFWAPPHDAPHAQPTDRPWAPPAATDLVSGERMPSGDGVVAIVGLHRAPVVEEAVRAGTAVTAVLVSSEPAEFAPLARLVIADVAGCLRQAFPRQAWPPLRVVCDESGALAAAAGAAAVSDETELAVRIRSGRIVARAEGPGACHAVATSRVRHSAGHD
jgi:AcrR family transcriptional regulator